MTDRLKIFKEITSKEPVPDFDATKAMNEQLAFIADMMGVNYHVGIREVIALKVLTTVSHQPLLFQTLGLTIFNQERDDLKQEAAADSTG